MATGLTWIRKLDVLDDFLPFLIHQIRPKIEKEYFQDHVDFVLAFFPRYYKQHRLLKLGDLVQGLLQATVRNVSLDEGEKYAEEFCTMWILEFVEIYELFEGALTFITALCIHAAMRRRSTCSLSMILSDVIYFSRGFVEELKRVQENFEQLADLDLATSQKLAVESTLRFGPIQTYIFVVLMSVLFDANTMGTVRDAAHQEIRNVTLDLGATMSPDASGDRHGIHLYSLNSQLIFFA